MGDLEGAPAVHINFPLLSLYLYTTFKAGIAASGWPIPSEYGMFVVDPGATAVTWPTTDWTRIGFQVMTTLLMRYCSHIV